MYRHYSWEHSYFSGKTRSYLRYKERMGGLAEGYEDILATPAIINGLLLPATGSPTVPQIQLPDGRWVQDTSDIIDAVEAEHPEPAVVPPTTSPRQRLVAYLVELLADEWMLVWAFCERWHHSLAGVEPNHLDQNALQWGSVMAPEAEGSERLAVGHAFFDRAFQINDPMPTRGTYAGLRDLGVNPDTHVAWKTSFDRILGHLEAHFGKHDFLLGGRPSLGDFGLMGPLYAHIFRDAVSGFELRTRFPIVADWVERTNGVNALNARTYDQTLYALDDTGELVGRPACSDAAGWLANDEVAPTLMPLLAVFFEEMWPVLDSTLERLRVFLSSEAGARGAELPGRSFTVSPGSETHQQGDGALTHAFQIGGVESRRMVLPYQVWMLQRIEAAMAPCVDSGRRRDVLEELLAPFPGGTDLLRLGKGLEGARVRKDLGRLYGARETAPETGGSGSRIS